MSRDFNIEEKIYQSILMLTVYDEFVFDVEKIRAKYNIDWITGNEEKYFYGYYYEGGHKICNSRFKYEIAVYDYEDIDGIEINEKGDGGYFKELESYKKYIKDVQTLMQKYNLTTDYETVIDVYVQQGFVLGDSSMVGPHLNMPEIEDNKDYITVKVFSNTTKKEYDKSWKASQILLDCLFKDKQVLRKSVDNLERDVEIMKLKKEGKTSREIYEIIKNLDKFENKLSGYDEVPIVTKRLNDRIKKLITH